MNSLYMRQVKVLNDLLGPEFQELAPWLTPKEDPAPQVADSAYPLVARFLRALMAKGGYSQMAIAQAARANQGALSQNLSGERAPTGQSIATFAIACKKLDPSLAASERQIAAQIVVLLTPRAGWGRSEEYGSFSAKGMSEFLVLANNALSKALGSESLADIAKRAQMEPGRFVSLLMFSGDTPPPSPDEVSRIHECLSLRKGRKMLSVRDVLRMVFP